MAGIYIHVPFCKTRCVYCDFYSTTESHLVDRYIDALCRELEMRKEYLQGQPVETIYWGGGTPSQLSRRHFAQVFHCIDKVYGMEYCREITLEANPDDLTPEYLNDVSSLPFNRISIGIQTFDDVALKLLKRRHTAQQAMEAVRNSRLAGFENISIDLIYGLPGETPEKWAADLSKALELNVQHISAYHLIYEEGTPLYAMLKSRAVAEVNEEDSTMFFSTLINTLSQAGYEHYEISNFCLPGKQSIHNSSYWDGTLYLGCGPSAHSYNGSSREWNVSSLTAYMAGVENNRREAEREELDTDTRYNDLIITALRTRKGLDLALLEKEFGEVFLRECLVMAGTHIRNNALEVCDGRLRLTAKGIFVSDGIMSDLLRVNKE
ncbi:radical SAM family heme chaperone HemW [Bacteroides sp. OttesenSCG-928-D19]|nr:radical SAM family heme chaperone HemW [Bacteroides sp. OttesenSCG-928-D19]